MAYFQSFLIFFRTIFEFVVCILISGVFSYFYKDKIWEKKNALNSKMERFRDLRVRLENRSLSDHERKEINVKLEKQHREMLAYGQKYFLMKFLHYLAFFLVICMCTENLFCRGMASIPLILSFFNFFSTMKNVQNYRGRT